MTAHEHYSFRYSEVRVVHELEIIQICFDYRFSINICRLITIFNLTIR